jgi:hypothetical protein
MIDTNLQEPIWWWKKIWKLKGPKIFEYLFGYIVKIRH